MIATAAIASPTLAFVRTAQLAPGPAGLGRLVGPCIGLLFLSAVLHLAGWTLAYFTAPAEAKTGHITLRMTLRPGGPGLRVASVRLRFDGGLVPRTRSEVSGATQHPRGVWTQTGLSAGHYDACVRAKLRVPPQSGGGGLRHVEYCEPIVVTNDPVQALTIEVAVDER